MSSNNAAKVNAYTRYPLSSFLTYNGVTVLHYLLGGIGIVLGYGFSWLAYLLGSLYVAFALLQMYVLMPLTVCPNCVYYRLENARCVTGMNLVSKRIARQGHIEDFPKRAQGRLCHNNLYMAAKVIPIILMIPALIVNFSFVLLAIFLAVLGLLLFRIFVIFPRIACVFCQAANICPNAQSMGIGRT